MVDKIMILLQFSNWPPVLPSRADKIRQMKFLQFTIISKLYLFLVQIFSKWELRRYHESRTLYGETHWDLFLKCFKHHSHQTSLFQSILSRNDIVCSLSWGHVPQHANMGLLCILYILTRLPCSRVHFQEVILYALSWGHVPQHAYMDLLCIL